MLLFQKGLLAMVLCTFGSVLFGQDLAHNNPEVFAETITPIEIKGHVDFLASDVLEGRLTAARGQKIAAQYIATQFQSYGMKPGVSLDDGTESFFQKFSLIKHTGIPEVRIETDTEEKIEHMEDFVLLNSVSNFISTKTEVLLLDKTTLERKAEAGELKGKSVAVYGEDVSRAYRHLAPFAYKYGVRMFFCLALEIQDFERSLNRMRSRTQHVSMSLSPSGDDRKESQLFLIAGESFLQKVFGLSQDELMRNLERKDSPKANLTLVVHGAGEEVFSENVVGVIPGTDKRNEYIFITSHYDHEGIKNGEIYNGADDNASGTSAVLEIAEAFAMAAANGNRPRRTLVFMTVSGEEKGLLGSEYYVDHPIFPIQNTVADFNIDMVGRLDEKHQNDENYIYLIGSDRLSKDLHDISESVNKQFTSLDLDYTFNAEDDPNRFYYRSDHYNFAKNNIPVIFYFNGVHEDYHQPTDTPDKILHGKIARISTLIFHTIWEVANREDRLRLNGKDVKEIKE